MTVILYNRWISLMWGIAFLIMLPLALLAPFVVALPVGVIIGLMATVGHILIEQALYADLPELRIYFAKYLKRKYG